MAVGRPTRGVVAEAWGVVGVRPARGVSAYVRPPREVPALAGVEPARGVAGVLAARWGLERFLVLAPLALLVDGVLSGRGGISCTDMSANLFWVVGMDRRLLLRPTATSSKVAGEVGLMGVARVVI